MTSTPESPSELDEQAATAEGAPAAATADVAPALPPIDEAVARELALAALHEITPAATVGEVADASVADDGVLTLRFANRLAGYPGWFWTVGVAQVEDSAPTVLEVELTPGDGALTAPEWLPWAERLAEYEAAQAALAAEGLATDDLEGDDEDLDDVDDLDALDYDNDGSPILHSGDVDGVDIDELADDEDVDDEDLDDSDDEDDSDDLDDDSDDDADEDEDEDEDDSDADDEDDSGDES